MRLDSYSEQTFYGRGKKNKKILTFCTFNIFTFDIFGDLLNMKNENDSLKKFSCDRGFLPSARIRHYKRLGCLCTAPLQVFGNTVNTGAENKRVRHYSGLFFTQKQCCDSNPQSEGHRPSLSQRCLVYLLPTWRTC